MSSKATERVKVAVRCRPLSKQEVADNRANVVSVSTNRGEISIRNPNNEGDPPKTFTFDIVYDEKSQQEVIYQETAYAIVDSVLEGYNGTIFAYGQTGTGKTFTMEGDMNSPNLKGITPRSFEHVFKIIEATPNKQFLVRVSYLEIYNEDVRDLLHKNANKLELKEKPEVGFYVKDLTSYVIRDVDEMYKKLAQGHANRAKAATNMNLDSSRSHSIFMITVENSEIGGDGEQHIRMGKLNLVDLAGSERQSKTGAVGERFEEAININKSLSALGNVISALVDPKAGHIPYRDSKLTKLLMDSLGGNTKTVMVANLGPADHNYDESVSTLRYANRAKNIKNKPRINEDPKDALLREYQDEIAKLKAQLAATMGGGTAGYILDKNGNQVKVTTVEKVVKVEDESKLKEAAEKLEREKEEMKKKLEQQVKQIREQKNMAEDEKQRLLNQIQEKAEREREAKESQAEMIRKIKDMQHSVLQGNKAKEDVVRRERELQKARMELEERKAEEKRLLELKQQREEAHLEVNKKYTSLQEEVDAKRKELQKLFHKMQEVQGQLNDEKEEHTKEREYLMDQVREYGRQLKLRALIIQKFIPPEEQNKMLSRAQWNDGLDNWVIPLDRPELVTDDNTYPQSSLGFKRPVCEAARISKSVGDQNPRFRYDNIMQMDLDMPDRTTEEFEDGISNKVMNTISTTLDEQPDEMAMMTVDGMPNIYFPPELEEKKQSRGKSAMVRKASAKPKPKAAEPTGDIETKPEKEKLLGEEAPNRTKPVIRGLAAGMKPKPPT